MISSPTNINELVELVIPDACDDGLIKWKRANDGYMRVLFESGIQKCKIDRENEFRVCMAMSKASSMVWDVTKGVTIRQLITLSRNGKQFLNNKNLKYFI